MGQGVDFSRTIEEQKADEFSEIVRGEVRACDGFASADETGRDAMLLDVAQKFLGEDGGFQESDEEEDGPESGTAGEMIPAVCKEKIGNSNVLVLGYMPVDAFGQVTLFTARYEDDESVTTLSQNEFKSRVERALRFFKQCYENPGQFGAHPAVSELARHIDEHAAAGTLRAVRIVFVTNLRLSARDYDRQANIGLDVNFDVYDIDRLYRASDQTIGIQDIEVDFEQLPCGALPCLEATGKDYQYKSYLLMLDGGTLAALFRRYGSRLYDTNLRSYLESKTKVNKGMLSTIRSAPQKFLAYNNGLTAIASGIDVAHRHGQPCVTRITGLQIVNGAQTTSTIYKASTDKKNPPDLSHVHVIMKLTKTEPEDIDTFVPEITEFANTQNPIKGSDLQANKLIHRRMEQLARDIDCPGDPPRQWFYERTRGAYQAALAREGTTRKKREEFQERIPASNRFDKTDLAIYHMAWSGYPHSVSRGPQKNFVEFTKLLTTGGVPLIDDLIDERFFKNTVAKAIVYEAARKAVAKCGIPKIPSKVTAYLFSYFAQRFGKETKLAHIWDTQRASDGLKALFERWAPEINRIIIESNTQDKLIDEWCKKDGCWSAVQSKVLDASGLDIPEFADDRPAPAVPTVAAPPRAPASNGGTAPRSGVFVASAPQPSDDDIRITMRLSPEDWGRVAEWVAAEPGFAPFHRTFAYSMATYASQGWAKEPSEKQAKIAAQLARGASRASVISLP